MQWSCPGLFPDPRSCKLPTLKAPGSRSKLRSSPEAKVAAGKLSFLGVLAEMGRRGIWAALPFLPGGCVLNPLRGCPPRGRVFPPMDGPGGWGWGLECVWARRCTSVKKTPPIPRRRRVLPHAESLENSVYSPCFAQAWSPSETPGRLGQTPATEFEALSRDQFC